MGRDEIRNYVNSLCKPGDSLGKGYKSSLIKSAYHEAGHAVMAFLLKRSFKCITIKKVSNGINYGGFIYYGDGEKSDGTYQGHIKYLMGALSGLIAEIRLTPPSNLTYSKFCKDDLFDFDLYMNQCLRDKMYYYGEYPQGWANEDEKQCFLSWLYMRTKTVLYHPVNWGKVCSLAEKLIDTKFIRYPQAIEIIMDANDCEQCPKRDTLCKDMYPQKGNKASPDDGPIPDRTI